MVLSIDELLERLWIDYVAITPQAAEIHALLDARGEQFRNDHIALRTFDLEPLGLDRVAEPFERRGWRRRGAYRFEAKKLRAVSLSHDDPSRPRVFVSELRTSQLADEARAIVRDVVARAELPRGDGLLLEHPTWPAVGYEQYERLLDHSEYAAWLAAFGIRVNHFTVAFDDLRTFQTLDELNACLRAAGFELNGTGRQIQGGPEVLLEQSSTVAAPIDWTFADGEERSIRSCYYEFARRYPDPATGRPFDGFVTTSADKIFESTDRRH